MVSATGVLRVEVGRLRAAAIGVFDQASTSSGRMLERHALGDAGFPRHSELTYVVDV